MMNTYNLEQISWMVSEDTYRQDESYSYSLLAKFYRTGFKGLNFLFDRVESPSLSFGSLVDCLITEGQEVFENKYIVLTLPEISDTLKKIANTIKGSIGIEHLENLEDEVIDAIAKEIGYYSDKRYDKTRVSKVRDGITLYYNELMKINDKIVISQEDYNDAINCVEALKNNEETRKLLFVEPNPFSNIEKFNQLKFKGEIDGLPVKAMLDCAIVDNDNKTITPIDLKTSSKPEYEFYKSFKEWSYFIQASLYSEILRQNIMKDPIYKEYKILPFRFVVINKKTLTPMVWVYKNYQCLTIPEDNDYDNDIRNIIDTLDKYLNGNYNKPIGMEDVNIIEDYLFK